MGNNLIILASAGAALLVILVGGRLLYKLIQLPCPPGFIFILESRMMENVAGPEAIIQRAGIQPNMRVLDAGCGPGRISVPLAAYLSQEGQLVALDVQEEMLKRLAQRLEKRGLDQVEMIQGGLGTGQIGENQFDRALLITVLGEIPDQSAALAEIYRALVPGGLLSITEVLPDPHYQRLVKVQRLGEEAGFQPELVHKSWRSYTLNLKKPQY
jgi:ubiquinone/menaquinone biosynthesis C-methylase UbiE